MRRHELDTLSLVAGIVFVVVGAAVLVGEATGLRLRVDPRWVLPAVLVGFGTVGLLAALPRRRGEPRPDEEAHLDL